MPPDPGRNLSPSARLPTTTAGIGHVAPDFDDRKLFNTLVIRPEYRISLRLGRFDELFPNQPNTPRGRMERMQALGLFYLPLNHSQANTAHTPNFDHFKRKILNNASNEQADGAINHQLEHRIVDGGVLPPPAAEGATPAAGNLVKIRLPGGYTFVNANGGNGVDINNDPAYPLDFGADLHQMEDFYYNDNPVLGKIPLVARVERRNPETTEWEPARDAAVYFQLQRPYDLPAHDPNRPANAQLNRPALRGSTLGPPSVAAGAGPKKLTDTEEARNPTPTDPQANNCHQDRGGKRGQGSGADGSDVANVIFETTSRAGFNTPHPGRVMSHKPYPVAQQVTPSGDQHAHAVKVMTNEDGEAGVIFMPSRAGGDRYRIRAYVGPDTLPSDGTGPTAVRADTGTFVVWRNIRVSRYVRLPANAPEAGLLTQAAAAPYSLPNATRYLRAARVVNSAGTNVGLPTADFSPQSNASAVFDGAIRQFARAFCELELDRGAVPFPETLSQADWQAARLQASADGNAGMGTLGINYNLTQLLCMEAGSPVNAGNSVSLLPMRTAEAYNATLPAGSPQRMTIPAGGGASGTDKTNVNRLFKQYLLPGFLRSLSGNGHLPGLTVVQGAWGGTWQLVSQIGRISGIAKEYRGCFVFVGAASYPTTITVPQPDMPYDFTSNTCHEMGHCIYRNHGPGNDPGGSAGGGNVAAEHDPLADNTCVMSYRTCEGQFCAKCLFAFRGWDAMAIP